MFTLYFHAIYMLERGSSQRTSLQNHDTHGPPPGVHTLCIVQGIPGLAFSEFCWKNGDSCTVNHVAVSSSWGYTATPSIDA